MYLCEANYIEKKNAKSVQIYLNALDVYTKINIKDYLARPEAKFDKEYSEERKKIRQYIRKDDLAAKRDCGVIDWSYLLNADDGW